MTDRSPLPPFFWMSFMDRIGGDAAIHLGIAIVEAHDISDAVQVAWQRGCNPGGEVCGRPLSGIRVLPRHLIYRLLDQPSDIAEAQVAISPRLRTDRP
jgi:hypothetical protein